MPLIGSARLTAVYGTALRRLGIEILAIDAADATIAGLKGARAQ